MEMEDNDLRYIVDRPTHTEKEFQKKLGFPIKEQDSFLVKAKTKVAESCTCSKERVISFFTGLFPIVSWLQSYQKQWLPGDIVAGFTVGVVHIPQSLAFSILAGLAPVFGLYTSFYPVLIYTLMGTSRHISVGTFAVTSLLTRSVVFRYYPPDDTSIVDGDSTMTMTMATMVPSTNDTGTGLSEIDLKRAGVATAVAFLMGIFQVLFGIFRLGFITSYMSEPLIQGFTTGAALQVVTSQTPAALGINIRAFSGPPALILSWIEIFKNLPNTHIATLVITIFCIIFLTVGREINLRYKQKMKIPLPTEVILVVIAILASHFGRFQEKFDVVIVNSVPLGLPPPVLPNMNILGDIVADGFAIAIVGFAISVSLSKMYGIKHGYTINPNQELVAYGAANLVPSFFLCFPSAAALARCEIQDNTGGNTQVVGIISVIIVLIVALVLGPIFEPLPRTVLACIIIVGLFGIIAQLKNLKTVYKASKIDFVIWIVTLLAVLILGVDIGLLVGIVFAILTVIFRTQVPRFEVLANVADTDIYRSEGKYQKRNDTSGIVIVKMHASLYYANKDFFKNKIAEAIGFDPGDILTKKKNAREKMEKELNGESTRCCKFRRVKNDRRVDQVTGSAEEGGNVSSIELGNVAVAEDKWKTDIHTVIVDCGSFGFTDFVGGKLLKQLGQQFSDLGISFFLANCNVDVRNQLQRSGFMDVAGEDTTFVSVHDAALFSMYKHQ